MARAATAKAAATAKRTESRSDEAVLYDARAEALRGGTVRGDWRRLADRYARQHFSRGARLDGPRVVAAGERLLTWGAVTKRGPGYVTLGLPPAGANATPDSVPGPGRRPR